MVTVATVATVVAGASVRVAIVSGIQNAVQERKSADRPTGATTFSESLPFRAVLGTVAWKSSPASAFLYCGGQTRFGIQTAVPLKE